jgi:hypothetical protein
MPDDDRKAGIFDKFLTYITGGVTEKEIINIIQHNMTL